MIAIIYHGSKQERMEIRRKHMPKAIGPKFPLIITSYEVALNDAKFLAQYKWKYVVVDEVKMESFLNLILYVFFMDLIILFFFCLFLLGPPVEE